MQISICDGPGPPGTGCVGLDGQNPVKLYDAQIYSIDRLDGLLFYTQGTDPGAPSASRLCCMDAGEGDARLISDVIRGK